MTQAVAPMLVGVRSAVLGDATLDGLLTGVHAGRAPKGAVPPYLILPNVEADGMPSFGATRRTTRGTTEIRIWGTDALQVAEIYGHLERVLDRSTIALEGGGHVHVAGKVSLVTMFPDPQDAAAVQGVARFAWIAHRTG